MEKWDLYDQRRARTGETMVRGEQVPPGRYHLVVDVLFVNSRGETLLQRRADEKDQYPGYWSVTGGSAVKGENNHGAAVRETKEEMGFTPDLSHGRVLFTEFNQGEHGGDIRDVYLIRQDIDLKDMVFQPEEVQDAMWILPEKIKEDAELWAQLNVLRFWGQAYPYLCLESMRARIPLGVYRHYKGNRYQVLDVALHSETLEPMVIYRALYGPGEIWTRPASMWSEWVQLPNGQKALRFAPEEL